MKDKVLKDAANAFRIQSAQRKKTQGVVDQALNAVEQLNQDLDAQSDELDRLLAMAEGLCGDFDISLDISDEMAEDTDFLKEIEKVTALTEEEQQTVTVPLFEQIETVDADCSWDEYMSNITAYADANHIDLSKDPFEELLTVYDRQLIAERIANDYQRKGVNCDRLDYCLAAISGAVSAIVDMYYVASPKECKLLEWTDHQTEEFVTKVSCGIWKADERKRSVIQEQFHQKMIGMDMRNSLLQREDIPIDCCLQNPPDSFEAAVKYLEKRFKVGYDSVRASELKATSTRYLKDMKPINHHIKSLSHSPDVVGLLFSIVDQFTSQSTFIDHNRIIHLTPKNNNSGLELRGGTFAGKILAGAVNWLGHLLSDIAGSSGAAGRGTGLCAPFMELLQLCPFSVKTKQDGEAVTVKISELVVEMFENGYDFRFSVVQMLPVTLNECMIRIIWGIRQMLQYNRSISEILKDMNTSPDLHRMLLVGHGTLCVLDAGEAVIAGHGEALNICLHLNFMAWLDLKMSDRFGAEVNMILKKWIMICSVSGRKLQRMEYRFVLIL